MWTTVFNSTNQGGYLEDAYIYVTLIDLAEEYLGIRRVCVGGQEFDSREIDHEQASRAESKKTLRN